MFVERIVMINVCFYGEEMNRLFKGILLLGIRDAVSKREVWKKSWNSMGVVEY